MTVFVSCQSSLVTSETKLSQTENEVIQLRANIKQYEGIMDEYKNRVSLEFLKHSTLININQI